MKTNAFLHEVVFSCVKMKFQFTDHRLPSGIVSSFKSFTSLLYFYFKNHGGQHYTMTLPRFPFHQTLVIGGAEIDQKYPIFEGR